MTWPRRLRTALTVLCHLLHRHQPNSPWPPTPTGPTNPTGFADLLPTPDLTHGDTRTLFEQYSPMVYGLDFETSFSDPFNMIFNGYALHGDDVHRRDHAGGDLGRLVAVLVHRRQAAD